MIQLVSNKTYPIYKGVKSQVNQYVLIHFITLVSYIIPSLHCKKGKKLYRTCFANEMIQIKRCVYILVYVCVSMQEMKTELTQKGQHYTVFVYSDISL